MMNTFLASFTCSSTKHPAVCRFVWSQDSWIFVGASRQRTDASVPAAGAAQSRNEWSGLSPAYAGRPSCGSDSYVRCGRCRQLGCLDESWPVFTCPSCGNSGQLTAGIDSISSMTGG
jgi:hypothetical protein